MNNVFLHKLIIIIIIIIIYIIDADIIYSEILPSLQDIIRFKGVKRAHSTDSDGKLIIIIITKASKDEVTLFVDQLIESSNIPNTNLNKVPGRCTKYKTSP